MVFLVTVLLVGLSILLGSRLTLDGDVLALLPKDNVPINSFRDALKDFGGLDYLLVVLETKNGQSAEDLQEYADLLAVRLQKIPSIRYVEHRLDTSGPFFDFFRRNELLFLPPDKLPELEAHFTDAAIRQRVRKRRAALGPPRGQEDPAGGSFWISSLLREIRAASCGPESGYYLSPTAPPLMIAKPEKPP